MLCPFCWWQHKYYVVFLLYITVLCKRQRKIKYVIWNWNVSLFFGGRFLVVLLFVPDIVYTIYFFITSILCLILLIVIFWYCRSKKCMHEKKYQFPDWISGFFYIYFSNIETISVLLYVYENWINKCLYVKALISF